MSQQIYLVPLFPLIGFLLIGLLNRNLSKSLTGIIGSGSILASFIVSVMVFMEQHAHANPTTVTLFDWITAGSFKAPLAFLVDPLSSIFLLIITGIGFLIHVYSTGYMHADEGFRRFFAYLNLFVFFMLLLVLGDNYLVMFVGWEGVGLCSYLLIGFWFKNKDYASAAKKAFVMNRIGDLGFLLGILLIYTTFHAIDYKTVLGGAVTEGVATSICLLLFIGAMGKSAQLPLYTWLPDAMAGPTPVSALIHAATMVTAGIYMVARSSVLFSASPLAMDVVAWTGTLTALFAASIGFYQTDIKKVLAYSTVSQLGFMFAALGVGAFSAGVFHVVTHAFFKALMFLGAGSVIHAMHHEQDMRVMGGLRKYLPITHITFLAGFLAIIGFPFFSGWYSKDLILIRALEHNPVIGVLLIVGALMTTFYMSRLYFVTFWGKFRGTHEQEHHLHESPLSMTAPLMILAVLSVGGGFLLNGFMEHNIASLLKEVHGHENHTLHNLMWGVTAAVLAVLAVAYNIFVIKGTTPPNSEAEMSGFQKLVYNKYYVDELYYNLITKPLDAIAAFFKSFVEKFVIDGGVNGVGGLVKWLSSGVRTTQGGQVDTYFLAMVIGIVLILAYKILI